MSQSFADIFEMLVHFRIEQFVRVLCILLSALDVLAEPLQLRGQLVDAVRLTSRVRGCRTSTGWRGSPPRGRPWRRSMML